jgi:cell division septum initiation protein DivIVA
MFGRTKSNGEDVFETEERLRGELEAARRQLAETTAKLAELDGQYKAAATDALASGDDSRALGLRREIERLGIRKDGLGQRILNLEPTYQEVARAAQTERVTLNERARQGRLTALIADGAQAEDTLRFAYEQFQLALSRFDDVRAALGAQEFGNDGLREAGALYERIFLFGPNSLPGRLLANGWTQRVGIRPVFIEVTALRAPPGA